MGQYCRICGRQRPNEKFSGHGHKILVCQECSVKPKEERETIEQADEIFGFLSQSNISKKNMRRLTILKESLNSDVSKLAGIVLEVAAVKPFKRQRLNFLGRRHPLLLRKLEETGLILAHQTD